MNLIANLIERLNMLLKPIPRDFLGDPAKNATMARKMGYNDAIKDVLALLEHENGALPVQHADDVAVDEFAAAMKAKLAEARTKGRGGWETCDPATLSLMLREHVEKGDPRDVANFCMMLHHHRASTNAYGASADAKQWWITEGHRGVFPHGDRLGWEGAAKYGFDAGKRSITAVTKPVANVIVTSEGYAMRLGTYIAYALPDGVHDLYAAPIAMTGPHRIAGCIGIQHINGGTAVGLRFTDEAGAVAFMTGYRPTVSGAEWKPVLRVEDAV